MKRDARLVPLPILAIVLALCAVSATAQPLAPSPDFENPRGAKPGRGDDACAGGVIVDDGTAETGYGWVPSVIRGEYLQQFHTVMFPTRALETVCICWLRTRPDSSLDFDLTFYDSIDGRPAQEPYAVVPASVEVTPVGITESFFEVDVTGVDIPVGRSFIGARWDASVDQFFFVCADSSDETEPVNVFFRDEQTPDGIWTSVFETPDTVFENHKAVMIRATSDLRAPIDIPALGVAGLVLLAVILAGLGIVLSAGRRG
ncbi:MAG: hypothetical protein GY719_13300 [bacterium]|nr:hypothetical protein [bacterium]